MLADINFLLINLYRIRDVTIYAAFVNLVFLKKNLPFCANIIIPKTIHYFLIFLIVQLIRKCTKRKLTYIDICIYLNINKF